MERPDAFSVRTAAESAARGSVLRDWDVAAKHLGANALGHDEGADCISSRAGADQSGAQRQCLVLVQRIAKR